MVYVVSPLPGLGLQSMSYRCMKASAPPVSIREPQGLIHKPHRRHGNQERWGFLRATQ